MRMNLTQFSDMLARGELPEEYEKRMRKLRRLCNEKQDLEDTLDVLTPEDVRYEKKKIRYNKVCKLIEELR